MEITILLCLAAASMPIVALARFHDGNGYLYHTKNVFGLQQGKSKVFQG
jgi:hypothetical protein